MLSSVSFNSFKSQTPQFFECSGVIRVSLMTCLLRCTIITTQVLLLYHFLVNRHIAGKWQDVIAMDLLSSITQTFWLWHLLTTSLPLPLSLNFMTGNGCSIQVLRMSTAKNWLKFHVPSFNSIHEKANLNRAGTHPWSTHLEDNKVYSQNDLRLWKQFSGKGGLTARSRHL